MRGVEGGGIGGEWMVVRVGVGRYVGGKLMTGKWV